MPLASVKHERQAVGLHPYKFNLWIVLVSITMMFAAFTSAYLVRRADGQWLLFDIPTMFYWSTAVIILSSGAMHWAYLSAKSDNLSMLRVASAFTMVLGILFLVMQVLGWGALVDAGVYFGGSSSNPAGSFVYVLSLMHAVHLIGGVVFLLIVFVQAFRYKIHSKSMVTISMASTYWHFLDVLWVYLLVFMLLYR